MSTCPKCGAKIGPDEPAYVMEPFAGYVCEGCWRGTSRAYRRYDPAESYLRQRRRVSVVMALLMIVILLGLAILIGRCS